jgi:hypothetical protein
MILNESRIIADNNYNKDTPLKRLSTNISLKSIFNTYSTNNNYNSSLSSPLQTLPSSSSSSSSSVQASLAPSSLKNVSVDSIITSNLNIADSISLLKEFIKRLGTIPNGIKSGSAENDEPATLISTKSLPSTSKASSILPTSVSTSNDSLLSNSFKDLIQTAKRLIKLTFKDYIEHQLKSGLDSKSLENLTAVEKLEQSIVLTNLNTTKTIISRSNTATSGVATPTAINNFANMLESFIMSSNSSLKDAARLAVAAAAAATPASTEPASLLTQSAAYDVYLADLIGNNTRSLSYVAAMHTTAPLYGFSMNAKSVVPSPLSLSSSSSSPFLPSSSYKSTSLLMSITILYSLLIITSLTSNPLLIYVLLWRRKTQLKLIDIFVANLSLSDLFLTIFNIPLCLIIYFSEQWPFGSLLCQLGTYSTSCSIYVNIFTMAYISIDRYFAVTKPLVSNQSYQLRKKSIFDDNTRHKIYGALTVIWIIALILSVPQFFFSRLSTNSMPTGGGGGGDVSRYSNTYENNNNINNLNSLITSLSAANKSAIWNASMATFSNSSLENEKTFDEFGFYEDGKLFGLLDDIYELNSSFSASSKFKSNKKLEYLDIDLLNEARSLEDPLKRCILKYPYKNMKNFMVLINFSLQYLIPSIVILYFYGKIIYHLYLNLNVEELMDSPCKHREKKKLNKQLETKLNELIKQKSASVSAKTARRMSAIAVNNKCQMNGLPRSKSTQSINANHVENYGSASPPSEPNNVDASVSVRYLDRKRSRMRVENLNRTKNLKKSIKTMIIIIALFLLSWLPIHLYRLVTTFYPTISGLFAESLASSISPSSSLNGDISSSGSNRVDIIQLLTNATTRVYDFMSQHRNDSHRLINDCMSSLNRSMPFVKPHDCIQNSLSGSHIERKMIIEQIEKFNKNYTPNTLHNRYVFFFCYFMSMSSVCYNPIVYFWMHKKFRAEVKQIFNRVFNVVFLARRNTPTATAMLTRKRNGDYASSVYYMSDENANKCKNKRVDNARANKSSKTNGINNNRRLSFVSEQLVLNNESIIEEHSLNDPSKKDLNTSNLTASKSAQVNKSGEGKIRFLSNYKIKIKRFSSLSSESTVTSVSK